MRSMEKVSEARSCASLLDLKASFGKEAVIVEALQCSASGNNQSASVTPEEKGFRAYRASLLPRAWKFTRSLHAKGTRRSRQFILQAQVWVFSPRGIGVLATQACSRPFILSSTQNLRNKRKKRGPANAKAEPISTAVAVALRKKKKRIGEHFREGMTSPVGHGAEAKSDEV